MKKAIWLHFLIIILLFLSCIDNNNQHENQSSNLTIFFINDQQGQIDNFSKIKYIIDEEKEQNPNVIVTCSGDIFSGNPIVDNYPEKGYPMIDIMNKVGFDISVIGNHDFDYGEEIFKDRMEQSEFEWICANVDMSNSVIPEPLEYKTIAVGSLKVCFLGLIETNGKTDAIIPSTHPGKIENIVFERPENVVTQFANLKEQKNADLFVALTHFRISVTCMSQVC